MSCASQKKSHKIDEPVSTTEEKNSKNEKAEDDDEITVSGNFKTSTISLSNNHLTSKAINRSKAEKTASELKSARDKKNLLALMSAQRLAGQGLADVLETSKKLMAEEMKKKVDSPLPALAKLEIVLAAIKAKKLAMAEHFLADLPESKNKRIRAAAYTAQGMIAVLDDRIPEAVSSWKKALEVEPDYAPALLNLGYMSLKYGDYRTAKKMLDGMQNDWFAVSGLQVVEKLEGNKAAADKYCDKVLEKKPEHKPSLYNCALHEYQSNQNYDKAQKLLNRMLKARGDGGKYEEHAHRLLSKINSEKPKDQKEKKTN